MNQTTQHVDLISQDPQAREVRLSILWPRPLDLDRREAKQLSRKINAYVSFIKSGELARRFPDQREFEPVIEIASRDQPAKGTVHLLARVARQLAELGIGLRVAVVGGGDSR